MHVNKFITYLIKHTRQNACLFVKYSNFGSSLHLKIKRLFLVPSAWYISYADIDSKLCLNLFQANKSTRCMYRQKTNIYILSFLNLSTLNYSLHKSQIQNSVSVLWRIRNPTNLLHINPTIKNTAIKILSK